MRILLVGFGIFLTCNFVFAEKDSDGKKNNLLVQALNSPVKERLANFRLTLPAGITASKANYRFEEKKAHSKEEKQAGKDKKEAPTFKVNKEWREIALITTPQGEEARLPVSELPPGGYEIEFKVSRSWKEKIQNVFRREKDDAESLKGEVEFSIDASLEVPDPGPAGKVTLAGIDSDNDGVRDDVQRWIAENFGNSLKTKAAMKQQAEMSQLKLMSAEDRQKSIAATYKGFKAQHCLWSIRGIDEAELLSKKLIALQLNTDSRIRADIKTSANFNGQSWEAQSNEQHKLDCAFNPGEMPN
jgi:hypothetical protein